MKILHSTIKKKWFDMIAAGIKKEEYKDIKDFWKVRLFDQEDGTPIEYDAMKLYNGWACSEKYPNLTIEFKGVEIKEGKEEWGAEPGKKYFVIILGELTLVNN